MREGVTWLWALTGIPLSGLNSVFAGMNKGCYLRDLNLHALNRQLHFIFYIRITSWPASQPFSPSQSPRGFAVGFFPTVVECFRFGPLPGSCSLSFLGCLSPVFFCFSISVLRSQSCFLLPSFFHSVMLCSLLSFFWLFPFPNCQSLDHKDALI